MTTRYGLWLRIDRLMNKSRNGGNKRQHEATRSRYCCPTFARKYCSMCIYKVFSYGCNVKVTSGKDLKKLAKDGHRNYPGEFYCEF